MKIIDLQIFEIFSIVSICIFLFIFCFGKPTPFLFPAIIFFTLILHFFLETIRWQIIPAVLVFIVLSIFLAINLKSGLSLRITGTVLGSCLIGLSLILIVGLPLKTLPNPSGKYSVGTIFLKKIKIENSARDQYIQVWYPVNKDIDISQFKTRTLWQQIYEAGSEHNGSLRFFTKFLSGIETHSHEDAPLALSQEKFPIISYQHGMVSFTSENTLLMETLASNGYIIIANSYKNHFEESKKNSTSFNKSMSEKELLEKLKKAKNRKEVSDIMSDYALSSEKTNFLVKNRVNDASYILDNVVSILNNKFDLSTIKNQIVLDKIGIIGYSLGGAIAIEMSNSYKNCSVGINLDGIHYGQRQNRNLNIPFLSFSKEITAGANDKLLKNSNNHFLDITIKKTEHANFHEMSFFFPIFKWLGMSGKANAKKVINYRNNTILSFLNRHLKDIHYKFDQKVKDLEIMVIENKK